MNNIFTAQFRTAENIDTWTRVVALDYTATCIYSTW